MTWEQIYYRLQRRARAARLASRRAKWLTNRLRAEGRAAAYAEAIELLLELAARQERTKS